MRFSDNELIDLLADFNRDKPLYVPTHVKHPNEITPEAEAAVQRLHSAGVPVNNQAVLLRVSMMWLGSHRADGTAATNRRQPLFPLPVSAV